MTPKLAGALVAILTFLEHSSGILAQVGSILPQDEGPNGIVTLNGGAKFTNTASVQLLVRLTNQGAGELEMAISTDPGKVGTWVRFVESQQFELPSGDGNKTINVRLRDLAGRESKPLTATIVLDTIPPQAKVKAPEQVSEGLAVLESDVSDAVAMQWTEDPKVWGPWEMYVSPREIHLSPGQGVKTVLIRYRDEAGNVSEPATLRVEVAAEVPRKAAGLGVRQLRVTGRSPLGELLPVTLWIVASEVMEMEVQVDASEPFPRERFQSRKDLELPKTGGAHRIRLQVWDATGTEGRAEVAFQEADIPREGPDSPRVEGSAPKWSAGAKLGVLPSAVKFEALTSKGFRKLSPGALGLARAELTYDFYDPFFARLAGEFGYGKDVDIVSGDIDFGMRLLSTELFSTGFELNVDAGLIFSQLQVKVTDFGSFDPGAGFRVGLGAHFDLSESLRLDVSADFRDISYKWSGTVVTGDRDARTQTVAVLLGFSVRF